jgi:sterol desaturase/sphingolipid hydroxylase (fatty acid hydroxylase superfamily)
MDNPSFVVNYEGPLRLAVFVLLAAAFGWWERAVPKRGDARPGVRQLVNLALMVMNTALLRFGFPILATGFALWCAERGVGLLNVIDLGAVPAVVIGFLCLDLALYWQHRLFHRLPWLWRLHRVHHSDTAFDLTLGVRFHPIEIVLSMLIKFAVIAVTGAPAMAVVLFEIVLSAGSLFTHADADLDPVLERRLRRVIVTPDMHRIHHSVYRDETDSNFGFHISIWDRLFLSYRAEPRDGHTQMAIGLPVYREPREQSLLALIANPFRD